MCFSGFWFFVFFFNIPGVVLGGFGMLILRLTNAGTVLDLKEKLKLGNFTVVKRNQIFTAAVSICMKNRL